MSNQSTWQQRGWAVRPTGFKVRSAVFYITLPDSTDSSSATAATDSSAWDADAGEAVNTNQDLLTNTALASYRYDPSNRAVAAVLNAFQFDIGRATPGASEFCASQSRVTSRRRAKSPVFRWPPCQDVRTAQAGPRHRERRACRSGGGARK